MTDALVQLFVGLVLLQVSFNAWSAIQVMRARGDIRLILALMPKRVTDAVKE